MIWDVNTGFLPDACNMGDDITKGRRDSVAQAGLLDLNEEFGSTTRSLKFLE